jgi:hypothetical protein
MIFVCAVQIPAHTPDPAQSRGLTCMGNVGSSALPTAVRAAWLSSCAKRPLGSRLQAAAASV